VTLIKNVTIEILVIVNIFQRLIAWLSLIVNFRNSSLFYCISLYCACASPLSDRASTVAWRNCRHL